MNIEILIDAEADKMFDRYFGYYIKKYPRKKSQTKEKYIKYFTQASRMFCVREGYNAYKLIDAFMLDGFKFPQQLPNEAVWETYKRYLPGLHEDKSEEIEIAEDIANGVIETNKYGGVSGWLSKTFNQKALYEGNTKFNPIFLSFSIKFNDFYDDHFGDFKVSYDLDNMRSTVMAQPHSDKMILKLKSVLKDDFFE